LDNGVAHDTDAYANLMWLLQNSDVQYVQAVAQQLQLGSVTIRVLPRPLG